MRPRCKRYCIDILDKAVQKFKQRIQCGSDPFCDEWTKAKHTKNYFSQQEQAGQRHSKEVGYYKQVWELVEVINAQRYSQNLCRQCDCIQLPDRIQYFVSNKQQVIDGSKEKNDAEYCSV